MSVQNPELIKLKKEIELLKIEIEEKNQFCINSREKFEKALMASPDAVCILDLESYTILELNKNFEEQFGFTIEEAKGKDSVLLNLWVDKNQREKVIKHIKSKGAIKSFETEIRKKNGKIGKVIISAEKIISDDKNCLLIYFRSITELRETESNYRLLAENSTDVIWILGLDGKFTYISPSVYKLRGYRPEEVLKQTMPEVMTPDSTQKVMILMKSFIDQERNGGPITESLQTEIEQICKDGTTVWTEVMVTPLRSSDGVFNKVLGVSRNIRGKKIAEQKASQHTKTIEGIFRSAPIGIGMTKNRIIEMVNDQFCKITGYSREDVIGKDARIIYASDEEYNRVGKIKYDKIKQNKIGEVYTSLKKKDGKMIDVLLSSSTLEPSNLSKGVVFNILDLSALKEAEMQLAYNEEKYLSFFNNINDAVLIHPWKEKGFGNFIEVNDVACKIYGYSKEELQNLGAGDITDSANTKKHADRKNRTEIKDKGSRIFEATHIRKDGSTFPVEISSNIFTIEDETIILSVVRDISERKMAEAAIDESELKYKKMFENSPEAMVLVDNLGIIRNCNSAFYEISGRTEENVINKHFVKLNLLSVAKLPEYIKLWAKILREKKNQVIEFDWKDVNGEIRKSVGHFAPIIKKNKIAGFQALLKDITQQKEFEKNLIIAKEQAEESSRLKSAFLETMSHELRTPLNAVIGFSNLIEDESNIDNIMEMNSYVTENGKKLLNIIESIFDISVLETRSAVLKTEEFSIDEMFEELETTLKGMIELERKTAISTFYQPGVRNQDLTITTDKQRLKQLLTNLLTNAVRYSDKGSIRYGYTRQNGNIQFFVADTGIGIPQNKLSMIFQKFTQVDSSPTRIRGGLGLGLSIVDEIGKLLGGEISLESKVGKGSTFYFTIAQKRSSDGISGRKETDLNEKTFLIVEDVESNYLYLEKVLTESGASVLWAQTGQDAIAIAEKLDKIDLILMDIRMPDIDGYEISRKIKKIRPDIPIIAQTAYAMASDRKEALEAGCSDHIAKPIKVDTLLEIVKKYIKPKLERRLVI